MVAAVSERWHVTTHDFESYADLYRALRAHLRTVARTREYISDLFADRTLTNRQLRTLVIEAKL